ncbi:MAG TPA: PRC-barrel domain-containing protein [Acidimicrobiales bacterium]|nr:PRC-barrel domain-containing protein [Acidimicrobiales bacterium]
MRLSDLLGKRVVDADGHALGTVTDVPLARTGPELTGFGPAYVVAGLRVSKRSGNFFGYEREDARGPALVRSAFRWLHRGDELVTWARVADVGDDLIRLRSAS